MAKRYHIATQNGYIDGSFSKAQVHKELATIVRDEAQACRRRYNRCSVIGTSRSGSVKIIVGGRQGYHLWQRFVVNEDR